MKVQSRKQKLKIDLRSDPIKGMIHGMLSFSTKLSGSERDGDTRKSLEAEQGYFGLTMTEEIEAV